MKYIALLRGINVGGHRKVKMDDLKAFFKALEFENVTTYIQSGNVIFGAHGADAAELEKQIEKQLELALGFEVDVLIRTVEELKAVIEQNPFDGKESDRHRLFVTFLKKEPSPALQQELCGMNNKVEEFRIVCRTLYSLIDKKSAQKPRFSNNFIEKHFDMAATTRNWRSVSRILELAEA